MGFQLNDVFFSSTIKSERMRFIFSPIHLFPEVFPPPKQTLFCHGWDIIIRNFALFVSYSRLVTFFPCDFSMTLLERCLDLAETAQRLWLHYRSRPWYLRRRDSIRIQGYTNQELRTCSSEHSGTLLPQARIRMGRLHAANSVKAARLLVWMYSTSTNQLLRFTKLALHMSFKKF